MPRPDQIESIIAMADPERNSSAEERGVALTMLGLGGEVDVTDREALIETARNALMAASVALSRANGIEGALNARDMASHVQKYIRDRKLGIEAENVAAEIVFLAEYKAGRAFIEGVQSGEFAPQGGNQPSTTQERRLTAPEALNVSSGTATRWMNLAREYPDEETLRQTIAVSVADDPDRRVTRSKLLAFVPQRAATRLTREDARVRRALEREALRDPVRDDINAAIDAVLGLQGLLDNGAIRTLDLPTRATLLARLREVSRVWAGMWEALENPNG